jgi:hypothetical protein
MADEFPEAQCDECDTLRTRVQLNQKLLDRLQSETVKAYPTMNYNGALEAHQKFRTASDKLKKSEAALERLLCKGLRSSCQ